MEKLYHLRPATARLRLQMLQEQQEFGKIRSVDGLVLIEKRDYYADAESDYECWTYLFERSKARELGMHDRERLKGEVLVRPYAEPRPDAIIAYLDDKFAPWCGRLWRVPMHVGRVISASDDDITVRSKFGHCDVFEHPVNFIPLAYGKYAKFVYIDGLFDDV